MSTTSNRRPDRAQAARERAKAAKAAELKAERRRRIFFASGSLVLVLVIVGVILGVGLTRGKTAASPLATAPADLTASFSAVPTSAFNAVGVGTAQQASKTNGLANLVPLKNAIPVSSGGKPEVLYIGGEFCPYCAAERWAIATALGRFGTLQNLELTSSSSGDTNPNTPTISFRNASYSSPQIAFTAKEVLDGASHKLQTLNASETKINNQLNPQGSIPFLDIAGKYAMVGPQFDGALLKGMTQAQVAASIKDPTSKAGAAILASANVLTAGICDTRGSSAPSVCSTAGVKAAETAVAGTKTVDLGSANSSKG